MQRRSISVVIPAYRAAGTIASALRSVFIQSIRPDEVIVVDDGSPDALADVVARDFPEVRLLRQANAGPAAARNRGAAAAKGEWLAFLDADDAWLPGKLERQLEMAAAPDVGVIAGGVLGRETKAFDPAPGFDALWERNSVATSSALVRRAAYQTAGGMEARFRHCEDYHLWLRLAHAGWRVVICAEPMVVYTPAATSLTHQLDAFAEAERMCVEDIAARFRIPSGQLRRRIAESYRQHARGALHVRQMRSARAFLRRSLRYRVTARQVVDLMAASAPRTLLDLRRWLRGGDTPVGSPEAGR
ncbi:glycosyltransferase family 2 protein [Neoroseomonas soli]|uniref:Glycosyltransferase family 2 protein n=1 Tax=Neoroseomonas soli TaxID=1081025 RepID=A0A9X9WSM6_9PROT|nr:glycosyltransferase family A protein [Neoroseomonas soli]MBR0670155.1 glycosyltransferase family 2 protein [Neoroseomonas soli]